MEIFVVLVFEFGVKALTKLTNLIIVLLVLRMVFSTLYFNELVLHFLQVLLFLSLLCTDWSLVIIPVVHSPFFLEFLLDCLEDFWTEVFEERLDCCVPCLVCDCADQGNTCISHISVFIVCVLCCECDHLFVVFSQLEIVYDLC